MKMTFFVRVSLCKYDKICGGKYLKEQLEIAYDYL